MCTPKRNGGAGFYSLGNVNLALLTKLAWRLVLDPNALVSKVLFAKYGKNMDGGTPTNLWF